MKCASCKGLGVSKRRSALGLPFEVTCTLCRGSGLSKLGPIRRKIRRWRNEAITLGYWEHDDPFGRVIARIIRQIDIAEELLKRRGKRPITKGRSN